MKGGEWEEKATRTCEYGGLPLLVLSLRIDEAAGFRRTTGGDRCRGYPKGFKTVVLAMQSLFIVLVSHRLEITSISAKSNYETYPYDCNIVRISCFASSKPSALSATLSS